MPESLEALPFPAHGVNLVTEFESQPPQTTPIGINVRAFDSLALRNRGGSRPGLAEYIPLTVLGFPSTIQHLNIIVDPTVAGLAFDGSDLPPDETELDPSTNNHRIRNPPPGRQVRKKGSGRGLNVFVPPPPKPKPNVFPLYIPPGATFVAFIGITLQVIDQSMVGSIVMINVTVGFFVGGIPDVGGPVAVPCTLHQCTDPTVPIGAPAEVSLPPNPPNFWENIEGGADGTISYGCGV